MKIRNVLFAGVLVSVGMADAAPSVATNQTVKKMRDSFERFEGYLRCVRRQKKCTNQERTRLITGAASLIAIMATASLLGYRKHSKKRPLRTFGQEAYEDAKQELEGEFMALLGNGVAETLLNPNMRVLLADTYSEDQKKYAETFLVARKGIVDTLQRVEREFNVKKITLTAAVSDIETAGRTHLPAIKNVTEKYQIGLQPAWEGQYLTLTAKE